MLLAHKRFTMLMNVPMGLWRKWWMKIHFSIEVLNISINIRITHPMRNLIQWDLNKMAHILQTAHSNAFSCKKSSVFWFLLTFVQWSNWQYARISTCYTPDSKVHGANMGPTWVLSAPDGPHVGPMNLAIRDINHSLNQWWHNLLNGLKNNYIMQVYHLYSSLHYHLTSCMPKLFIYN